MGSMQLRHYPRVLSMLVISTSSSIYSCCCIRVVEQSNVPKAMDLLKQACELFELEDKEHYSGETFKIAINLFLRNEKYDRVTLG